MFDMFTKAVLPSARDRVLDVGVTSDQTYESSNYLEAWYEHKANITAVGIDDASFLETRFPGVRFVRANGLDLPFDDRSYDVVHSSAVLEHVGSRENQIRFMAEGARICERAFFLTTPNRWFPVEFHTTLPLLHWLPMPVFRWTLRKLNMKFLAREENLNLLSTRELQKMVKDISTFDVQVSSIPLGGWTSNLIIIGKRREKNGK
ncbi:MAG: hypothetical protein CBHOC_2745 [uncultured Caballeronia sp.]|nr:MAG: hypothetical protein CBHOC_2745 [uncultured Caballeronia sp.]